jgi:hypothetical protein
VNCTAQYTVQYSMAGIPINFLNKAAAATARCTKYSSDAIIIKMSTLQSGECNIVRKSLTFH